MLAYLITSIFYLRSAGTSEVHCPFPRCKSISSLGKCRITQASFGPCRLYVTWLSSVSLTSSKLPSTFHGKISLRVHVRRSLCEHLREVNRNSSWRLQQPVLCTPSSLEPEHSTPPPYATPSRRWSLGHVVEILEPTGELAVNESPVYALHEATRPSLPPQVSICIGFKGAIA